MNTIQRWFLYTVAGCALVFVGRAAESQQPAQRARSASPRPFLPVGFLRPIHEALTSTVKSDVRHASFQSPFFRAGRRDRRNSIGSACSHCGTGGGKGRKVCWLHRAPCCVQPLGSSLQAHMDVQIAKGLRDQLVLYRYDFENDPRKDRTVLNDAGLQRLRRFVPYLQSTGFALHVEPEPGRPDITEARRVYVMDTLANEYSLMIDDSRIIARLPEVPGVDGVEAIERYEGLLQVIRSQGLSAASAATSGSGFSFSGEDAQE